MTKLVKGFIVVAAVTGLLAIPAPADARRSASANLVRNGSFEEPSLGAPALSVDYPTGTRLGRWTVERGGVFVSSRFPNVVATDGEQTLALRPTMPYGGAWTGGKICQWLPVRAGATYALRFDAASVYDATTIVVRFQGHSVARINQSGTGVFAAFTSQTLTLTSTVDGGSLCLSGERGATWAYPVIDNMSVVAAG